VEELHGYPTVGPRPSLHLSNISIFKLVPSLFSHLYKTLCLVNIHFILVFQCFHLSRASSQLSPSIKSFAYRNSFTKPSLIFFVTSSITNANKKGLSADLWWIPVFTSNDSDHMRFYLFRCLNIQILDTDALLLVLSFPHPFFLRATKSPSLAHDEKPFPDQQTPHTGFSQLHHNFPQLVSIC